MNIIEHEGGRIAYDDTLGDGPLIVCLPGMGDNRQTYRHLRPLLVAEGCRVVTVDPRGQGESDAVWSDYSAAAMGRDLLAVVRHLDAGPAVLMVNSYTGATAVWASVEDTTAFRALVLIGPFVRKMPKPNVVLGLAMRAVGRFRPLWMMYWSTLFKTRKPADLAAAKAALSATMAQPGRMAALRAMFDADNSVCEARLPQVGTPTLVVMGSKDPDFPDPAAEASLVAGLLRGGVVMIDGAGHYPQAEYPAETARAVVGFLRTVSADA